jgi:hypothetical protein
MQAHQSQEIIITTPSYLASATPVAFQDGKKNFT